MISFDAHPHRVGIFYADNTNNLVYNNFEILFSFF